MKKSVIILLHISYWLMYLLLLALFFGMFVAEIKDNSGTVEIGTAFLIWTRLMIAAAIIPGAIGFYGFSTLLFDRFLKRKKIAAFFGGAFGIGIAGAFGGMLIFTVQQYPSAFFWSEPMAILSITVFLTFVTIVNGVLGLVMKGFISWYGDIRVKDELTRKNNEIELALIKAQLNPHFLFNTINNIDVLIQKDPDKASLYLNKLSDMLRFMLYETGAEEITLDEELNYIEHYIELQRIRTSNPNFIAYTKNGSSESWKISPMLFIPFIENAFKYSENKKIERAIDISITMSPEKLIFTCSNHFKHAEQTGPNSGGLGLLLIRRRLELLFGEKHELRIDMRDNIYTVNLEVAQ